jgi:threonine/homoserine/homoserine lactone efflux protein
MFMFYLGYLYLFTYIGVDDVHVLFILFVFIYIYWSWWCSCFIYTNDINKAWTSSTPVYVNKYKLHK